MNATFIVHWPGQDTPACDDHAKKLQGIAGVLGLGLSMTTIVGAEIPCSNCENEKKKEQANGLD